MNFAPVIYNYFCIVNRGRMINIYNKIISPILRTLKTTPSLNEILGFSNLDLSEETLMTIFQKYHIDYEYNIDFNARFENNCFFSHFGRPASCINFLAKYLSESLAQYHKEPFKMVLTPLIRNFVFLFRCTFLVLKVAHNTQLNT